MISSLSNLCILVSIKSRSALLYRRDLIATGLQSDFMFSKRAGGYTKTVVTPQMVRVALFPPNAK